MKYLLFLFILPLIAKADYSNISLSRLVCRADYGAIGTIVKLDKNYFYLEVDTYVLGELELDTLPIQRFENWNCGKRYAEYTIGQKELVFFRKSNYVIEDYELIGYGAGAEFELPISNDSLFYNYRYNRLQPYNLKEFLVALSDFDKIKQKTKENSIGISKDEQETFARKSEFHKLLITCRESQIEDNFKIPTKGCIVNLETNYLYQDYENKVYIPNINMDSVFLYVENADVWKREHYFIVKPKEGWVRRFLTVYSVNDTSRNKVLFSQIFNILELPKPKIFFGSSYRDTIYTIGDALPTMAHYLDDMHEDDHLNYELLSYTYDIISNGKTTSFKVKSPRGTKVLHDGIRQLKSGDTISVRDLLILYPDGTVIENEGRSIYFKKLE